MLCPFISLFSLRSSAFTEPKTFFLCFQSVPEHDAPSWFGFRRCWDLKAFQGAPPHWCTWLAGRKVFCLVFFSSINRSFITHHPYSAVWSNFGSSFRVEGWIVIGARRRSQPQYGRSRLPMARSLFGCSLDNVVASFTDAFFWISFYFIG